MNYTFSIIKPDSMSSGHQTAILNRIVRSGFSIAGISNRKLEDEEAKAFYEIHKDKPFYKDLIKFMTSDNVIVLALYKKGNAVNDYRELIGDTNPKEANTGTIRNLYGTDISHNAVHGADSNENAKKEILFFFPTFQF